MDSLQSTKCEVCQEQLTYLRVDAHQTCKRYASDKRELKLFSTQNNINPGTIPPELTVSYKFYLCTPFISFISYNRVDRRQIANKYSFQVCRSRRNQVGYILIVLHHTAATRSYTKQFLLFRTHTVYYFTLSG